MTFEYPGFLYFLLLAFIPVIIHLFNLRRSKKVVFSNTKLLTQVKSASKSKTKIQRWLTLLMRILFVIFLVLAFAQPKIISEVEEISDDLDKIIIVDNSLSMQLNKGEGENLEIVKNTLLNSLKDNISYTIFSNSGFSKNGRGKDLEEYVSSLKYSNNQKSLDEHLNKLAQYQKELSVYFFSDFQTGILGNTELDSMNAQKVYLIPLDHKQVSNVFVDSLWIDRPFPQVGQTIKLTVRLRNSGEINEQSVGCKLELNDMQQGATLIELKADEFQDVEFNLALTKSGYNTGKVTIDDGSIYFDNSFYFCINTSNKVNIALISSKEEPYLTQVYNDTLFDVQEFTIQEAQTMDINIYDMVVLDELPLIPEFLIESIVSSDIVTMVVPSAQAEDLNSYYSLYEGLEVVVEHQGYDTLKDEGNQLMAPDFENPFFEGVFEKEDANMEMPFALPTVTLNGGYNLLSTKNSDAVLNYYKGSSRVYIWAMPLTSNFTDIPTHSIFLPVMYKAATLSLDVENKIYHTYGEQSVAFKGDFSAYRDRIKLMREEKELANAKISPVKMLFELPSDNLSSGIFEVGTQDSVFHQVAINYPKQESIMEFTPLEELQSMFNDNDVFEVKPLSESIQELEASIGNEDNTFPYWKICLILSLIFLLGETLLIRYYK